MVGEGRVHVGQAPGLNPPSHHITQDIIPVGTVSLGIAFVYVELLLKRQELRDATGAKAALARIANKLRWYCPSPLLMHGFCMENQVIGCAS
jgi:hypothetical protein